MAADNPSDAIASNAASTQSQVGDCETKRVELLLKLAASAQARFDSRRDVEWKVTIGLWTIFVTATAAIISARYWQPSPPFIWAVGGIELVLVATYWLYWLPYLAKAFSRDQRTSFYWESAAETILNVTLHPLLEPKHNQQSEPGCIPKLLTKIGMNGASTPWIRYGQEVSEREANAFEANLPGMHASQIFQLIITLTFAILLFVTLLLRASAPSSEPEKPEKLLQKSSAIQMELRYSSH